MNSPSEVKKIAENSDPGDVWNEYLDLISPGPKILRHAKRESVVHPAVIFSYHGPYKPATTDYTVEAEIRVTQDSGKYGDSFGVVVRANDHEGATRICYLSAG